MLKKFVASFIAIIASMIFCTSLFAVTKSDILNYVNSQNVCGDETLFNTYKSTFTRLLKNKDLSSNELDKIYAYLKGSVSILEGSGVCKLDDLSKLTKKDKETVYNNLTSAAGIITNAKDVYEENVKTSDKKTKESSTKIMLNTSENTIDIYDSGVLIDKVNLTNNKMTYTGTNLNVVLVIAITCTVIIFTSIYLIKNKNSRKLRVRIIKNIFISLVICSFVVLIVTILYGNKISSIKSLINMMKIEEDSKEYSVKLNSDKEIIRYPSYGANYGVLHIDDLDIEKNIYYGDSIDILNLGIGHTTYSNMPTEGGVIIYSSHNNKESLANLKNITIGDKIVIDTTYAKCTYKVSYIRVLEDTQTNELKKIDGKETLIIYTCYPFNNSIYTNKRYVVYSTLENIEWK